MNKKVVFFNILLVISVLLTACGNSAGPMPSQDQTSGIHQISAGLQATEEPPVPMPTIIINPTQGAGGGSFAQIDTSTLLLYILVGAIILIALIAVLRKS